MKLLDKIMGNTEEEVLSTAQNQTDNNIAADQSQMFSGLLLSVVYKPDHSDIICKYTLMTLPTPNKDIYNINKNKLSSVIKNIHQQLNDASDEYSFLCINDCLIIRKEIFVIAEITEYFSK
jgi:hypothetical protein